MPGESAAGTNAVLPYWAASNAGRRHGVMPIVSVPACWLWSVSGQRPVRYWWEDGPC